MPKEQRRIRAHQNDRGWLVEIAGTTKDNGQFSYSPTEGLKALEKLAAALLDQHVEIREV